MIEQSRLFNAMRGIAIIGIVIAHSEASDFGGIIGKIAGAGARGVQIFFIISSVLMFKSLDKFYEKSDQSIIKWYIRKFFRLIPLYYIANIYFLCSQGLGATYWTGGVELSIACVISNFLFLHGFNPWYINAININWYIGTLAIFIMIEPFLYKTIDSLEKSFMAF